MRIPFIREPISRHRRAMMSQSFGPATAMKQHLPTSGMGAYFGSTKIIQGAGGLGQDGELASYADGVFTRGDRSDAETAGALMSFHDGSLGDAPLQAYSDGVVGGSADDPDMPGPLFSYHDGVLGSRSAVDYSDSGGGAGGGGGSDGGAGAGYEPMADHPEPIQSYQDGVFGGRGGTCGLGDSESHPNTYEGDTPITAANDGIFGRPFGLDDQRYGGLQSFHDGSLGAIEAAPAPIAGAALDLGDPAALAEVKALIAYSSGGYALSTEAQKTYTPDWYTSGIWEPSASALWQFVASAIPAFSGKTVSGSAGAQTFPNGTGVAYLYATLASPSANALGPDQAAKMFPLITSWFNSKGTAVLPPYLSIADRTKGVRGGTSEASMSTMAKWGLGAAALIGVALVFTRKKR